MTYFCIKPWMSKCMKIVIADYLFVGVITYVHYISAFTNYVTITRWEVIVKSHGCCLSSPIVRVSVQERNTKHQFLLYCCITTLGSGLHSMSFSEENIGGCLGLTISLEAADKAIVWSAGQASPWFGWWWSLSIFFTFGLWLRLWLTYAVCQMMSIRQERV